MDIDEYRQELLKKYALAQYYLGIKVTYHIKHQWFGNEMLMNVPIDKLESLIREFRIMYHKINKDQIK